MHRDPPDMTQSGSNKTELGNYFVANYPPFSFWKNTHLPDAFSMLNAPPVLKNPLGLYVHI
ncbi:MAG: coproporphyrinogen III oxidase, partial [Planctomycetia bacterium]